MPVLFQDGFEPHVNYNPITAIGMAVDGTNSAGMIARPAQNPKWVFPLMPSDDVLDYCRYPLSGQLQVAHDNFVVYPLTG